jgi:hypothetical protein
MFGWFSKKKEAPIEPNAELTNELHNVRTSNLRLSADLQQANTAMAGLRAERDSLHAKVREQNEADLLLVSMQIQQKILGGEKKENLAGEVALQQRLVAQQSAMQNLNPYHGGLFGSPLGQYGGPNWWSH